MCEHRFVSSRCRTWGDIIYSVYEEICHTLELTPVGAEEYLRATSLKRDAVQKAIQPHQILKVDGQNTTWGLVRADERDGCAHCLRSSAAFVYRYYDGFEAELYDDLTASALIQAFHCFHDVSIAVTNAYSPQSWSVLRPIAACRCAARDALTFSPRGWSSEHTKSVCKTNRNEAEIASSGRRTLTAEDFVDANRWAIGFGSIVGNPIFLDPSESVALVSGPVRTSHDLENLEIAGGKGFTLEQSLASFLGEAVERYALALSAGQCAHRGISRDIRPWRRFDDEFGFPVNDEHPSLTKYDDDVELEWLDVEYLNTGLPDKLPANMLLCPYVPVGDAASIVVGSTNGAAAGATIQDARRQAAFELVERDAFWYYARTGAPTIDIESHVPLDVMEAMRGIDGKFYVGLLANPFLLPVVSVSVITGSTYRTKTARGTGLSNNLTDSIKRAFSECVQMLYSLDTGKNVAPTRDDMRSLWFSGQSVEVMPNFFAGHLEPKLDSALRVPDGGASLEHIVASAVSQGMNCYAADLGGGSDLSVQKVIFSDIAFMDPSYFSGSARFDDFAATMGHTFAEYQYTGSLFM